MAEGYVRCVNGGTYDPERGRERPSSIHRANGRERTPSETGDMEVGTYRPAVSARARRPRLASTDPPRGAMGYELGMMLSDAEQRCLLSDQTFTESSPGVWRCSGAAPQYSDIAVVLLRFCRGALCQLDVCFPAYDDRFHGWLRRFDEIRSALRSRHGEASSTLRRITPGSVERFPASLGDGSAQLAWVWRWQNGTAIKLASSTGDSFVHVNYFSALGTAAPTDGAAANGHTTGIDSQYDGL